MNDHGASYLRRRLGNRELSRFIGEGAFGVVTMLDSRMALRPEIKRRILNGANAAGRVEHENIIQVFDVGTVSMRGMAGLPVQRTPRTASATRDCRREGQEVARCRREMTKQPEMDHKAAPNRSALG